MNERTTIGEEKRNVGQAGANECASKAITMESILFIAAGVMAIVCMFMNWFPVELDLGIVQLDDVMGKLNPFAMPGMLSDLEDTLGILASVLPESFYRLKTTSMILMACGVGTVALYVCAMVLRVQKKTNGVSLISAAASVGAVATSVGFCMMITGIYEEVGAGAATSIVLETVLKSPCLVTLLCGALSGICVLMEETFIVENCVDAIRSLVRHICDIITMIVGNIGYLISDVAGAIAGIYAGKWIAAMSGNIMLGVMGGLGIAGVVAFVCCMIACRVFGYSNCMDLVSGTK